MNIIDEYKTPDDMYVGPFPTIERYGMEIDLDEPEPSEKIKYISMNTYYRSAYMDYTNDQFIYGDWEQAWFIRYLTPCMLKYDGTVDYYLDPKDYSKKADGTDSDINDQSYPGNVMVGIPTVWIKVDTSEPRKPKYYFAKKQINSDYHAYAHINSKGEVVPYIYVSAYDTSIDTSGIMRSLSEEYPNNYTKCEVFHVEAAKNNIGNEAIWDVGSFSERALIALLLILIGKSTDTQSVFGKGRSKCEDSDRISGSMNTKGLFWGSNDDNLGVKVFGIEHFWGNVWKYTKDLVIEDHVVKYKPAWNNSGYTVAGTPESCRIYSTVSDAYITENGLIPSIGLGAISRSQHFCDAYQITNLSELCYSAFGGDEDTGAGCGAFACRLDIHPSYYGDRLGCSMTCKPLKEEEVE